MKTKSILFAFFIMSIAFSSCSKENDVKPSGNVTTVNKTFSDYSEVFVSDPFKVFVTFSDTIELVQIEANANLQSYISVVKQGDRLNINLSDNVNITDGNAVLNIFIITKQLNKFYGEGASSIELQNELISENLVIELFGASNFKGQIIADYLSSKLTGASNLEISGSSNSFNIESEGGSNLKDYDFETNHLIADLEGGCNLFLTVKSELDVKAKGASNVYYKGNGMIVDQNLSGGSQIIKMD